MKKFVIALCATLVAVTAQAQLFTYTFPGSDPGGDATVPTPPQGLSLSPFSRVNLAATNSADVFTSSGFVTNNPTIDTAEYVTFTIGVDPNNTLNLTSLTFTAGRSATGPQSGQVALFINSSASAYATFDYTIPEANASFSFDFVDVNVASSAEVRFYGANGTSSAGTLRLDNVSGFGAVTVVPEPSTYAMIGLGAMLLVGMQRFRRRRS